MHTYAALFRGINVGGNHVLPMKALIGVLERCGCIDVRTYIQSGNAVFRSALSDAGRVARRLQAAVAADRGFEPHVVVLTREALQRAVAANPFPEADDHPTSLHLFFLAARPQTPDLKGMEAIRSPTERYALKGTTFYLHAPDGIGRSKLAACAERLLGVAGTARNWRTVTTLRDMMMGT